MTGSSLVLIILPIAMAFALAVWIGLVFHAASHPLWRAQGRALDHAGTMAGEEAAGHKPRAEVQPPSKAA